MVGLPRQAVWAAAAVVGLLALVGAYEGWRRSSSGPADNPAAVGSAMSPTANAAAKTATALEEPEEPLPEALTEARVRTIVRQEIQSALNPTRAEPPPSSAPATPAPAAAPRPAAPPADTGGEAQFLSGAGR